MILHSHNYRYVHVLKYSQLVTNYTQSFLYTLFIRAGDPRPQPGTPQFIRHRQRIYLTILFVYFAYTLYEAHWELQRAGDLYTLLGVPRDVSEKQISSRYRRLAALHHPDKVAQGEEPNDAYFIALTTARDTLLDNAKRFAYDRFGPDILRWQHCVTIRDYVTVGLKSVVAPHYLGWTILLAGMQFMGWMQLGAYWRWWAFASLAAFEVACITRPTFPQTWVFETVPPTMIAAVGQVWASLGLPTYLPFQTVTFARRASLTLFVAISKVSPVLAAMRSSNGQAELSDEATITRKLGTLEQLLKQNLLEATKLLSLESRPFEPSSLDSIMQDQSGSEGGGMHELRRGLREQFVRGSVQRDREVGLAYSRAVRRRNGEAIPAATNEAVDDAKTK